jgi:hypothetical protein
MTVEPTQPFEAARGFVENADCTLFLSNGY